MNFEEIIRNKWLNKNEKLIQKIVKTNISDEDSLMLELRKSDFLVNNSNNYNKNILNERYSNENNKKYKQVRIGKFKFGKRN